jgi:hypothetical protein
MMRRAGANQSGTKNSNCGHLGAERRHDNGEDWFEMPSGENLLIDRSQEITIRNDNADHTQVYRTLNVPQHHGTRNSALSKNKGSGAIYL